MVPLNHRYRFGESVSHRVEPDTKPKDGVQNQVRGHRHMLGVSAKPHAWSGRKTAGIVWTQSLMFDPGVKTAGLQGAIKAS